ncbi:hypothetical protein CFP56_012251 [Quercus suber]|uniref:Uncharacterized protein n=1 Tax=Quercus suber TaxID=58331 RepID=A0AAW0M4Q9_QUESU
MPFGQLLKQECGCLDLVLMVGLDPFLVSLVWNPNSNPQRLFGMWVPGFGVDGVTGPFRSEPCKESAL